MIKTHESLDTSRPPNLSHSNRPGPGVIHEDNSGFQMLEFLCPSCHGPLRSHNGGWHCRKERLRFGSNRGVLSFLLRHRRKPLETFLKSYQQIRTLERWGSPSAQYYRDLPFYDRSGEHPEIWRIRSRTFSCFLEHLNQFSLVPPARVLDAGAGNCWLSTRLAERGFNVVAMDVNLDPLDGLGALTMIEPQLRPMILPVRSEFDYSPFKPGSFDIIIFNASIHYANDISRVLRNSLTLLRERGVLYILDTPLYHTAADGNRMLQERLRMFRIHYHVDVPPEFAGSFLTGAMLDTLREDLEVDCMTPDYGLSWTVRPAIAALLGRRKPAAFRVIAIRRPGPPVRHTGNMDRPLRLA